MACVLDPGLHEVNLLCTRPAAALKTPTIDPKASAAESAQVPVEIDEIIAVLAKEQAERAAIRSCSQHETKPAFAAEGQALQLFGKCGFGVGDEGWKGAGPRVAELEGEEFGSLVTVDLAGAAQAEGMTEALQDTRFARLQAAQGIDAGALSDLREARDHPAQASRKAARELADPLTITGRQGGAEQCIEFCKTFVRAVIVAILRTGAT